jgi:hypothetical protein
MDQPQSQCAVVAEQRLTRRQVAARLGISASAVRRMEGKSLHPERDSNGIWRFSPSELRNVRTAQRTKKRLPAATTINAGEIAARVFEAFAAGHGLRQIVARLRVEPAKVRALYAEWQLDLAAGERKRRDAAQLAADAKDQRERIPWMRALVD